MSFSFASARTRTTALEGATRRHSPPCSNPIATRGDCSSRSAGRRTPPTRKPTPQDPRRPRTGGLGNVAQCPTEGARHRFPSKRIRPRTLARPRRPGRRPSGGQFDRRRHHRQTLRRHAPCRQRTSPAPSPRFDEAVGAFNEVRMNLAPTTSSAHNKLYNVEGQIAQFNAGKDNLNFPRNAKEIKAAVAPDRCLRQAALSLDRGHEGNGSRRFGNSPRLHITTKDLPNWFWSDLRAHRQQDIWSDLAERNRSIVSPARRRRTTASRRHPASGCKAPNGSTTGSRHAGPFHQFDWNRDAARQQPDESQFSGNRPASPATPWRPSIVPAIKTSAVVRRSPEHRGPSSCRILRTRQRIFMQLDFVWSLRRASRISP